MQDSGIKVIQSGELTGQIATDQGTQMSPGCP